MRTIIAALATSLLLAISAAAETEHIVPLYSPGAQADCERIRSDPNFGACATPWVRMIEPLESEADEYPHPVTEVWLCRDRDILCFSAETHCGCAGTSLDFFPDWRAPVDYADEVMEHVFRPCMEYAATLQATREGIELSDEIRDRFVEEKLLPLQKPLIDNVIAQVNDLLNDPFALEELGYGILERRMEIYQRFRGDCLTGAAQQ